MIDPDYIIGRGTDPVWSVILPDGREIGLTTAMGGLSLYFRTPDDESPLGVRLDYASARAAHAVIGAYLAEVLTEPREPT